MRQFHFENCGLQFVEPEIAANKLMLIMRFHTVVPANAHSIGELFVLTQDHSRVSRGAEIFRWIKTEAAGIAHCPGFHWPVLERALGPHRLGCILDHEQIVVARDGAYFIHLTAQTKEVDWNESANRLSIFVEQFSFNSMTMLADVGLQRGR